MIKSTLKFDKDITYIVACSFGPDSMAAINFMYEEKLNIVAAHVNYHKRDVSNDEENNLRKWCKERKIPCEVLDTKELEHKGNFQKWARDIRYDFFSEIAKKYNTKFVVVAHQQDDLIETYLMQKKRGNCTENAGIAEKIEKNGIVILRPFTCNTKQEMTDYDIKNDVPFSIDISNLSNDYSRNKIRHEIVEKLSKEEKDKIVGEIILKNSEKNKFKIKEEFSKKEIQNLSAEEFQIYLISFVKKYGKYRPISLDFSKEILKAVRSQKSNVQINIISSLFVVKEYSKVKLVVIDDISYNFLLRNKDEIIKSEYLDIDFSNGAEDRNVFEKDYPITIRPIDSSNEYEINGYKSKVRRLLIDWKVPTRLRACWPGIYNNKDKLIYIPRYRDVFTDNHKSKMVIKLK